MGRSRLGNALRGNIEDLIRRAENPEAMLGQVIYDMNAQLMIARQQVCVAIADERVLRGRVDHHRGNAAGWERRAMLAVRAGDDNLARAALQRKAEQCEAADTLQEQWVQCERGVESLKSALSGLSRRIADAERQRTVLIARSRRAHAQMAIAHTLSAIDAASPWNTLARMEDRVVQLEAQAEAVGELGSGADLDLEAQFRALEAGSLDDELLALKHKMGLGPLALGR